jgi:hypothetical protein
MRPHANKRADAAIHDQSALSQAEVIARQSAPGMGYRMGFLDMKIGTDDNDSLH